MSPSEFYDENYQKTVEWMTTNAPDYVLRCYAEAESLNLNLIINLSNAVIETNKAALLLYKDPQSIPLDLKELPAVIKMETARLEKMRDAAKTRFDSLQKDLESE